MKFFRTKKTGKAQDEMEKLQGEVKFLKDRMISMQAKVPSLTPSSSGLSRPHQLPSMVEESSSRGVVEDSDRTPSISMSEASRTGYTATNNESGALKASSFASSNGDGEVYYKDGKKYRRVVRVVRSNGPNDATFGNNRTSSSRSVSSLGREDVTDGHVQAMKARYSITSVSSDVSLGSKSSCASQNAGHVQHQFQGRSTGESYSIATPTLRENKKTPSQKRWEHRPSPIPSNGIPSNAWAENGVNRAKSIDKARSIPEPPFFSPVESSWTRRSATPTNRQLEPKLHVEKKKTYTTPTEIQPGVTVDRPRNNRMANMVSQGKEQQATKPRQGWSQPKKLGQDANNGRTSMKGRGTSRDEIQLPKAQAADHCSSLKNENHEQGRQSNGTQLFGRSGKQKGAQRQQAPSPPVKNGRQKKNNRSNGTASSSTSPARPALPKDFLKEVKRQDVKLKSPPKDHNQDVGMKPSLGGANPALLAGIQAGMKLRKVEKPAIDEVPNTGNPRFAASTGNTIFAEIAAFKFKKQECEKDEKF